MEIQKLHQLFLSTTGISTDTRNILKNSIFFALKGQNFNGNEFAEKAINNGAKFAVIDEKKYVTDSNYILVQDVLQTLQKLAHFHRKKLKCPVLGITGTNGKTTSKELIHEVLKRKFKVHCTQGNLNNHIGVPLTILNADLNTEFLIIEMGANHPKEIQFLCNIADIDYGIITNIGKAHLEGFGSYEGIKKTKKELYDFLQLKNGTVFVNTKDELLMQLSEPLNRILYSTQSQESDSPYASVSFQNKLINSQLIGHYNIDNINAACSIGHYFGVPLKDIQSAIESYTPKNNRSQLLKTAKNNSLILDAYNANPSSMMEALKSFSRLKANHKLYILGDMLELGSTSVQEHQSIINFLNANTNKVILIGQEFGKCQHLFHHFQNTKQAKEWINHQGLENHFILIKGSRGIGLEDLIDTL